MGQGSARGHLDEKVWPAFQLILKKTKRGARLAIKGTQPRSKAQASPASLQYQEPDIAGEHHEITLARKGPINLCAAPWLSQGASGSVLARWRDTVHKWEFQ